MKPKLTKAKYAQPLTPDALEQAARSVYAVHQRGDENRGDQIDTMLDAATASTAERDMIMLRAQRLSDETLQDRQKNHPTAFKPSGEKLTSNPIRQDEFDT